MCDTLDQQLHDLVSLKKWKEIIQIGTSIAIEEKACYLWAWPTENNLKYLENLLRPLGISKILSIGCGSGLLEWIIQESIGIHVKGIELDNSWWKSSYSPKTFIQLSFAGPEITSDFLLQSSSSVDWNFALLFCYFNNHDAFLDYLRAYKGRYLFIIGPGEGRGTHTDPEPFEPNFDCDTWKLMNFCEIGNSKDFIAFYVKEIVEEARREIVKQEIISE